MKPDQHKKKRSAQYKKKHGLPQKADATKSNSNSKANSSSSASKSADASSAAKPKESGQRESKQNSSSERHERVQNRDFTQDDSEEVRSFARRKIESNWDRYEPLDNDADESYNYDGLKGADFKALLSQTGDASSQFRFKDEQLWEEEESDLEKMQDSEGIPAINCHDLSQKLMAIPLPKRLNIDDLFFEPSALKSFEDLASRHKEKLDSKKASTWTPANEDQSSLIFAAPSQVFDAGKGSDSIFLDSADEEEAKEESSQQSPLELSVSHPQDDVSHSTHLPELDRRLQDVPHAHKELMQDAPATQDVRSSLDKSDCLKDDEEIFSDLERTAAGTNKSSLAEEDKPESEEQNETIIDPVSNQKETDISNMRNTLQGHAKVPSVYGVVKTPQAKTKPLPELKTDDLDDDDDELNFLLGLENPVKTRSKPVDTSDQLDEEGVAGEELLDEGKARPTSHPEDADKKSKPGHGEAALKKEPSSQKGTDSLEDWLDSVLED